MLVIVVCWYLLFVGNGFAAVEGDAAVFALVAIVAVFAFVAVVAAVVALAAVVAYVVRCNRIDSKTKTAFDSSDVARYLRC